MAEKLLMICAGVAGIIFGVGALFVTFRQHSEKDALRKLKIVDEFLMGTCGVSLDQIVECRDHHLPGDCPLCGAD